VQPTNTVKNEHYRPVNMFTTGNSIFILSKGLYNKETVSYYTENSNGINVPAVRLSSNYIVNSLQITVIGAQNALLQDTILRAGGNNKTLLLDELYTVASGKGVDLFLSKKYGASKEGITHFSVNTAGTIKEEEMMVEVRYDYLMASAKNLLPGVLLVPYARNWRRGLMKLEYEPVH